VATDEYLAASRRHAITASEGSHGTIRYDATRLVMEVIVGIGFAHQQDVVHRDLKPANTLIGSQGVLHVSDFGLKKHLDGDTRLTRTGAILGVRLHMAPKQASGNLRELGPACDV
jgi:serine/threonine protein kinase